MIAACITTYNEQGTIGRLVSELRALGYQVLIADGGSTDATCAIASLAGARVWQSARRRGIGPSLMKIWRIAVEESYDGIIQLDAGGSHRVSDAPQLVAAGADMVIGSRFCSGAVYDNARGPRFRPLFSRVAAHAMNYAQSGAHWTDWTSGYRYFSRAVLIHLLKRTYHSEMHAWQIETLAYVGEAGFSIAEVPIAYRAGRSSFNRQIALDGLRTWFYILNYVGWIGSRL